MAQMSAVAVPAGVGALLTQLLLWPFSAVLKASRPSKVSDHGGTKPGKLSRL